MDNRDKHLLVLYALVFGFGIYTNMKISQQNEAVEETRKLNKDTWVL